jgi:S-DNA-T family DNA segregation ATPase FtsK/SpoIIIE
MASRTRGKRRARLVESETEEVLRRRGAELLGLILAGIGTLFLMALWTYSPDDPSIFSATDDPPQNALGLIGASVADPLHRALGIAAYGIPALFYAWGLRLVLHLGEHRAVSRTILAPLALLATAAFASTNAPFGGWTADYGLGGLLGDAAASGLLGLVPLDLGPALLLTSLLLATLFVLSAAFALGLTWSEVSGMARFLRDGSVTLYALIFDATGRAATTAAQGAVAGAQRAARLAERARAAREEAAQRRSGIDGGETPTVLGRMTQAMRGRGEEGLRPPAIRPVPPIHGRVPQPARTELPGLIEDDAPPPPERREEAPRTRPLVRSGRARADAPPREPAPNTAGGGRYEAPSLALLQNPDTIVRHTLPTEALEENARMLETVLDDYGVRGEIVAIRPGPVVTMYELEPAAGLKASRVIGLADDIARSMSALACRVSTIPGRSVIGIELPNERRERVLLREILSAAAYGDAAHALPLALGKDIGGEPVIANLARMPHLLIAGTTGSGKSVAINTMILSLLYRLSPEECRIIMIDPKMLELSVYDGIPHLLSPVVTDPKKAVVALKWVVAEMEDRYRKMSKMGVRNIDGYNQRVRDALERGEAFTRTVQTGFDDETGEPVFETEEFRPEPMPFIVVIVDEMADLMMVAGKEIEACIQRLAQMARASGIHLIMATQRPSVDVITGTIKANFPTRISFQVTSKIDSRTILGEMGAEQLLGQGDMLYMAGGGRITRVHGPFVSDEEVEEVVRHLKSLGPPAYEDSVLDGVEPEQESEIDLVLGLGGNTSGDDALYDQAVAIVARDRKCSTSYLQRKLSVGYNKAAKLVEQMEAEGVISQANHVGKREVLVPER